MLALALVARALVALVVEVALVVVAVVEPRAVVGRRAHRAAQRLGDRGLRVVDDLDLDVADVVVDRRLGQVRRLRVADAQEADRALDAVGALEVVEDAQLGREREDELLGVDVEAARDRRPAVGRQRVHRRDRDARRIVGQPAERHDLPAVSQPGRQALLDLGVDQVEVAAQRRRHPAAPGQGVGQRVDLEEAELDEVGAQAAAVDDLRGHALLQLTGRDQLEPEEYLAEASHRNSGS